MPDLDDRVTLLERLSAQQLDLNDQLGALTRRLDHAQFLHDAAQRRHSEALDRHAAQLALLAQIQQEQQRQLTTLLGLAAGHQDRMDRLDTILQAIKDLLDRGNGH